MHKLTEPSAEPFWLDILPARTVGTGDAAETIPAQRTQFRPIDMPMILTARQAATKAIHDALPPETKIETIAKEDPLAFAAAQAKSNHAFTLTMALLGIVAWEGVGDDDGSPVLPTPSNIKAYLANWRVFDAVDRQYVNPALVNVSEKNG